MLAIFLILIILVSCFMAFRRFQNNERAYAIAWLCCAAVNAYCLISYYFFPPA